MRINHLKVTDFRVHRRFEAEFGRFNFIFGANDRGKTSIALALEFLLTGRCDLTDARGAGAEELIRQGAKQFEIEAEIEGLGRVRRTRSRRSQTLEVAGRAVPLSTGGTSVPGIPAPRDVLSAVINAGRFLELDEAGQKRVLTMALAGRAVELPSEIRVALADSGIPYGRAAVENVSEADALYQSAYDERTALNRALKEVAAATAHDEPAATPGAPTAAEAQAKLRLLRSEKEELAGQRGGRLAAHTAAAARFGELARELAEVRESILPDDEAARLEKLRDDRPVLDRLNRELAAAQAERRAARAQLDALGKLGAECPACFRPLKKSERQEMFAAIEAKLKAAEAQEKKISDALAVVGDVDDAERHLAAHRAAMTRETRLEAEQKKLPATSEAPDTSDLDRKISELAERIAKGEAVVKELAAAEAERAAHASWAVKKEGLERRIASCEAVVAYAGPAGPLRAQLVGDQVGPFAERLNAALALFGYKVRFSVDPYALHVERDAVVLGPAQLSESGRFRFSIAFQVALAMATGVGLIVADRADVLYGENRGALADVLLSSELDQAIILATGEAPVGEPPADVRLFSLASAAQPVAA